jgi:DNA-binding NarL/FixJ family response regulator
MAEKSLLGTIPTQAKAIRVALVEDDRFIRKKLEEEIARQQGMACVAICGSAEEALVSLPRTRPDVVTMDINLPQLSGTECVRQLKTALPETNFLMLTVYEDSRQIFEALRAGASGYLLKRAPRGEILEAIRYVYEGRTPITGQVARKIVQYFNQLGNMESGVHHLSRREKEVLELLAEGAAYKEIADALSLNLETIKMYVKNIYTKLHVHSRGEAVAKYFPR